jgi:hypothetical protein
MKLPNSLPVTEGPLGFPLTDKQAFTIESLLKQLPKDDPHYAYRKVVTEKATTETLPGERSDVSWITTEDPDRSAEVVVAKGMNDSQFQLNPIVTLQHAYYLPPVGKSLWRKKVKDGERVGIKAKTQYPQKPESWPQDDWPPDCAFTLVQSGLLNGKSIGFLPLKVHLPTDSEINKYQWEKPPSLIIDEWVLLEYACCYLPCQQNAVVESVSKSLPPSFLEALGIDPSCVSSIDDPALQSKAAVRYEATAQTPEDHPWDGSAARERLRTWAKDDLAKYRKGFAYVHGDGKSLADYQLPHHDIIDGKLHVVWHGVSAAMAALHGARSEMEMSDEDRKAVYHHLARHYKQFGKEPPEPHKEIIPFVTEDDVLSSIKQRLARIDWRAIANTHLDRIRGRV